MTKPLYYVHKWIFPIVILIACIGVFGALLYMLGRGSKVPEKRAGNESMEYAGYVRLVVLVDNNPYKEGLETAWGLAVYLETHETKLLFDTGPDPSVLERNAEKLGIDLRKIDFIVISHPHGDHTGGLELFSSIKPGLRVYIPTDQSLKNYVQSLGLVPIQVNSTVEVAKGIFVVKPLYGPPVEEALAVKTSKGLAILVGCSHPGVVNLVNQAVRDLGIKPYLVLGGFHMFGASLQDVKEVASRLVEMGAEKIYPIHCSGDTPRNYLANSYRDKYGDGGVGLEIVIQR
jgi:7,8-dihydropterin-6-yl-methyl-4-(beta-D-ribofuranosyl)aminobenzene 5'-phosphate synthase